MSEIAPEQNALEPVVGILVRTELGGSSQTIEPGAIGKAVNYDPGSVLLAAG